MVMVRSLCPVLLSLVVALSCGCAAREAVPVPHTRPSQSAPAPAPAPASGALERTLYPVELVMDRQAALGLNEAQMGFVRAELQRAQTELLDLQWRLGSETEALTKVLATVHPDEEAALAAAERVVRLEGDVKLAHLRLLVRVKGQLTPAQQATLDAAR